jgi:hypothetical protein
VWRSEAIELIATFMFVAAKLAMNWASASGTIIDPAGAAGRTATADDESIPGNCPLPGGTPSSARGDVT